MDGKLIAEELLKIAKMIEATDDGTTDINHDNPDTSIELNEGVEGSLTITGSSKAQKYLIYSLSKKYKDKSGQEVSSGFVHVLVPKGELGTTRSGITGTLTYTGQSVMMTPNKKIERAEQKAITHELKKQHHDSEEITEEE